MNADRWRQIRALFEQALALEAAERPAFLDAQCGADEALRQEVESLLHADASAAQAPMGLLTAAPELLHALNADAEAKDTDPRIGMRLGPWRLDRHLGRGGMGSVYLASRDDGAYHQQVAIKLVRADWDVELLQQRFRAERQILAGLNHPHIARLLDGGLSPDGKPYLVLEYVDGESIVDYCDERRLDVRARLGLFITIGQAVAHAHHRLVVHRDLKPSNILVDATGQVKLLDFGIAKLLHADAEATAREQRMFTPEYAAPEQLRGEAVTTGVDIYALGLLLFDLLTGRRPYGSTGSTPAAYERAILTQEPQRPSNAAKEVDDEAGELAEARGLDPTRLSRQLRGDLDAIVLKALRKDPEQRYSSVEAMLDDVQRFIDCRPVQARRGDLRYRAGRFVRRHGLAVGLVTLATISLLTGLGAALWQSNIARQERDLARREAAKAESAFAFMKQVFEQADPSEALGRKVTAVDLLQKGKRDIELALRDEPAARVELLNALGGAYYGLGLAAEGKPLVDQALIEARTLGDPVLIGSTLSQLSAISTRLGLAHASEPLVREALALDLPTDARGESLRGELEIQLGTQLAARSEYVEAEPWFERGMARMQQTTGKMLLEAVIPYSSLLNSTGRVRQGQALLEQALDQAQRELPPMHPLRASLSSQLATSFSRAGEFAKAEPLMRDALAHKREIYGDDHPAVDITRSNLARLLVDLGRWQDAEQAYDEVLQSLIRRNGAQHPAVAAAQAGKARGLLDSGHPAQSEALWRAAQATAIKHYGELDATVGITAIGLARTLFELGQFDQALTQLALAEQVYQKLGPNGTRSMAIIQSERSRVWLAQGKPEPDCAQARAGLVNFSEAGVRQAYAQLVLGECLRAIGQNDAAQAPLAAGKAQLRALQSPDWPERRYAESLPE